jgi:hypothetical protein
MQARLRQKEQSSTERRRSAITPRRAKAGGVMLWIHVTNFACLHWGLNRESFDPWKKAVHRLLFN